MPDRGLTDVGGTPGGFGHFLLGFAMTCLGAYLLSSQVMVAGSYWTFDGNNSFGLTLLPMLIGIGLLFWNGRSVIGWRERRLAYLFPWMVFARRKAVYPVSSSSPAASPRTASAAASSLAAGEAA
jgi:hypothetical protein